MSKEPKQNAEIEYEQILNVAASSLGVDISSPKAIAVATALVQTRPWLAPVQGAHPLTKLGELKDRAQVGKIMGVGERTVSEYAFRDKEFPTPVLQRATLWAEKDIRDFMDKRAKTRVRGRPPLPKEAATKN